MLPFFVFPAILIFSLFVSKSHQHQCVHDLLESDIKISDPSYAVYSHTPGRFLKEYQNISILVDSSNLDNASDDFKDYILNNIMPAVTNYFEATLKVPERSNRLRAGGYGRLCSNEIDVPSKYNTAGVDADLIIFVNAKNEPKASYVAAASSCLLDTSTRRPIVGRMTYNLGRVAATTNTAQREKDIVTTLHEMTHALGFSGALYQYYINPETGGDVTGHITVQSVMGFSTIVLNLEPLTTRLRAYFNCSSLTGAYIENQGGVGSAGSHFERRIFYNEFMTASAIVDARVSEFTLALLEGTGWYQINYDMAESITWGKNQGCSFVNGPCVDKATKKANFEEFCSPILTKSCSWTKRSGSSCGAFKAMTASALPKEIDWWGNKTISQDSFSDNCPIQLAFNNLDCEDPDNQAGATLNAEVYGYGSKCFMGTIYPKGELASPYPYCFKSQCKVSADGGYYLEVNVGSATINCTTEEEKRVAGYSGSFYCPDPQQFCNQVTSEGFCRRKCSGRGTCVQKECVCDDGWTGFDCSIRNYTDQCSRCSNGNSLKTSCYGDQCMCNPSNSTCAGPSKSSISSTLTFKDGGVSFNMDDVMDSSASKLNQTAVDRAYALNEKEDTTPDRDMIAPENSSGSVVLPVVLGVTGFFVILMGVFFIVRYARRKSRMTKHVTSTTNKRSRPPRIQISKKNSGINTDNSNPNSPDLLKRGLSLTSHNESPLMKYNSPLKELHTPSIFKNYGRKAEPEVIRENEEFCLKIQPLDLDNPVENVEDNKHGEEKCVPVSISLPELGQNAPEDGNAPRASIQYF